MASLPPHYDVLGIPKTASSEDVRKAWKRMTLRHHPDRPGGSVETSQAIQEAYHVLSDPKRRKDYDQRLQSSAEKARATPQSAESLAEEAEEDKVDDAEFSQKLRDLEEKLAAREKQERDAQAKHKEVERKKDEQFEKALKDKELQLQRERELAESKLQEKAAAFARKQKALQDELNNKRQAEEEERKRQIAERERKQKEKEAKAREEEQRIRAQFIPAPMYHPQGWNPYAPPPNYYQPQVGYPPRGPMPGAWGPYPVYTAPPPMASVFPTPQPQNAHIVVTVKCEGKSSKLKISRSATFAEIIQGLEVPPPSWGKRWVLIEGGCEFSGPTAIGDYVDPDAKSVTYELAMVDTLFKP